MLGGHKIDYIYSFLSLILPILLLHVALDVLYLSSSVGKAMMRKFWCCVGVFKFKYYAVEREGKLAYIGLKAVATHCSDKWI